MNLGWAWSGSQPGNFHVGRCILVDTMFPWPSLHHGRENIRSWLDFQKRQRALRYEGPVRLNAGITTAVKECGDAEMRVWPINKIGMPRPWLDSDDVWREPLRELRRHIGHNLMCGVRLEFMHSPGMIDRLKTVPSLADRKGFWGWQRGEKEPTEKIARSLNKEIACQIAGFKPRAIVARSQGVRSWQ